MASDAPSAAWHPALMPNSAADLARLAAAKAGARPAIEAAGASAPEEAADAARGHSTDVAYDDRPPEHDTASTPLGHEHGTHEDDATVPAEQEAEAEDDGPEPSKNAAKHTSTMSFARTVSHEVNWTDDEESEWNLSRTDTDPFKSMPPSDRTNSFPPVPPTAHHDAEALERPPPSHQAGDVISEVEHDAGHVDQSAESAAPEFENGGFWGDDDPEGAFSDQHFVGGDVQDAEGAASDARYSEGLPLVAHEQASLTTEEDAAAVRDPFGASAGSDGDDFFDHIGAADGAAWQGLPDSQQPLERKSTMQVLESLKTSAGSVLDATLEEEHETGDISAHQEANETPEVAQGDGTALDGQTDEGDDLAAKWQEALAEDEDEDLLLDDSVENDDEGKALDPAAFFEDDDGFLDDEDEAAPAQPVPQPTSATRPSSQGFNDRYLPSGQTHAAPAPPVNPYLPSASPAIVQPPAPNPFAVTPLASPFQPPASAPPVSSAYGYGGAPPRPEAVKAQSFVDKSKGGYHSPYDLPMDVVRPRKRASMQHLPRAEATPAPPPGPPPPPRSASMSNEGSHLPRAPPSYESVASMSPPSSRHSNQAPPPVGQPPAAKPKTNFFEELPISSRPRPASRHSHHGLPSPAQASPSAPPPMSHAHVPPYAAPPPQAVAPPAPPEPSPAAVIPKLVAPERVGPYAPLQSGLSTPSVPPAAASSRYSPAPPTLATAAIPGPSTARYSPAPPTQRPGSGYAPAPPAAVPPPILAHQPRTSSPLAHFEINRDGSRAPHLSHSDSAFSERRGSSSYYEPRLTRVPSLPPTREVEETESAALSPGMASPPAPVQEPRYAQIPTRPRQTPPPPLAGVPLPQDTLSPPKRSASSYIPQPQSTLSPRNHEFVPPPRSHTQSPGAVYGHRAPVQAAEPVPRPSSADDPTSPRSAAPAVQSLASAVPARPRGFSQNLNLVPPTDGREHDPLQRWKGAPLISWGVGGTVVTSFPKDVPRYGISQVLPSIVRSPGEVKIKNVRDIQPLEDRLAKFPGPLKGKSKKKETIAWLTSGIEGLERALPDLSFHRSFTLEEKRAVERVLLWKVLRLFVEYDGTLEGSPDVVKAVHDVLSPGIEGANGTIVSGYGAPGINGLQESAPTQMQADAVDPSTVEQLKKALMAGDREQAVWAAADKRLWGHALLIANTVSPELYQKVSQEFIKKDVNFPGHHNESLAALYEVLSGNHEESVDELVPMHERAGLQMMATSATPGPSKGTLDGLDKWRETLNLVLSNRSVEDAKAITSLGNLLGGYGRAEAAHICFLFARSTTVFGGLDDPQSNFVLVGSDHRQQAEQFEKETEALLLSEVYEYGLSLTGSPSASTGSPHLAAYKLQHAMTLAEYGYRDKALQYCETILAAINAQTRRSPYHHGVLESAVDDFMKRLKQAPKEESNSWIPKPSMNKVSDSVWNRFNKFVAGEDNEGSGQGSPTAGDEAGPFARLAGGTPTISRPPSTSNGMEMFGNVNGHVPASLPISPAPPAPLNRTASRYAPMAAQAPAAPSPYEPGSAYTPVGRSSMERTSGEYSRSSQELRRQSSDIQPGYANGYAPSPLASPTRGYGDNRPGAPRESSYVPLVQPDIPAPSQTAPPATTTHPGYSPYAPQQASANASPYAPQDTYANASPYAPQDTYANASPYAPSGLVAETKPPSIEGDAAQNAGYQPSSHGYEPSPTTTLEGPATQGNGGASAGGYEPPSYQPYGYEPPSYEPEQPGANEDGDSGPEPMPKKKSFMDDDEDDIPALKVQEKHKADKDRENAELFRKAAEEDAKRAAAEKEAKAKKGWGFGGWFGGGGKKETQEANKPVRANLGEASSFYYDPEQKRWVNKKAGAEDAGPKTATPPPPRGGAPPRSAAGTPTPPHASALGSVPGRASAPPPPAAAPNGPPSNLAAPPPLMMMRSVSNTSSGPPSRPNTGMSNASSIDDLLGAAGPRRPGGKKAKKGGRYVDVMAK